MRISRCIYTYIHAHIVPDPLVLAYIERGILRLQGATSLSDGQRNVQAASVLLRGQNLLGFWVYGLGLGFGVWGLGFRVLGFRFWGLGLGINGDNGKEDGNYYGILGLNRDNGEENGNYYLGCRV